MKLKITPLNIVGVLAAGTAIFFYLTLKSTYPNMNPKGLYIYILGFLALITFIIDLILRFIFKDIRRIWTIELILIVIVLAPILFFNLKDQ